MIDQRITVMRGYPYSGKTTAALRVLKGAERPTSILCRDDLRALLFDAEKVDQNRERVLTRVQMGALGILLDSGMDVIIDDCNLTRGHVRRYAKMAILRDVEFVVEDVPTPLPRCYFQRPKDGRVTEESMRRMAEEHPIPHWPSATAILRDADDRLKSSPAKRVNRSVFGPVAAGLVKPHGGPAGMVGRPIAGDGISMAGHNIIPIGSKPSDFRR
jgi:tRNA uridine 5-carbamoylmethylation protein Kti12